MDIWQVPLMPIQRSGHGGATREPSLRNSAEAQNSARDVLVAEMSQSH